MRIGFDATPVVAGNTGVARYTSRLLDELMRRSDIDLAPFAIGRGQQAPAGVRHLRIPLRVVHALWPRLSWPSSESLVGPIDVLHALDMVPAPTRAAVVVTVHDVLPARLPHLYSRRARGIAAQNLAAARSASVVVADCASAAAEVADATGRPLDEIVVAPPGPLLDAAPGVLPALPASYVLAVGAITPRKGLTHLAVALSRINGAPPLVVAGPDGWRADDVRREVRGALGDRATFLGWVGDDVLSALYRRATVFAFPSLAEGFGIPVLEALALGAPVIASDLPPVREIAAGAALLVPAADEDGLTGALELVLGDDARRDEMASGGRRVSARFAWSLTAEAVVDAYRRASNF